jgi:hypothetical protein
VQEILKGVVVGAMVTITVELSRKGLLEAKEAIDGLLREHGSSTTSEPDSGDLARRKVQLFREWAGEKSWDFVYEIASRYEAHQEFTFEDLSKALDEEVATVKSWHRSASKPMNRVDKELEDGSVVAPKILSSRWDGVRQHYWMSEDMRNAIIEAGHSG